MQGSRRARAQEVSLEGLNLRFSGTGNYFISKIETDSTNVGGSERMELEACRTIVLFILSVEFISKVPFVIKYCNRLSNSSRRACDYMNSNFFVSLATTYHRMFFYPSLSNELALTFLIKEMNRRQDFLGI
jgi:hypothetical protein